MKRMKRRYEKNEKNEFTLSYSNSFSNSCYIQFLLASKQSRGSSAGENAGGRSKIFPQRVKGVIPTSITR